MRFRIRTLLIITALVAVVIAFFARPYLRAVAESKALGRFEDDWKILVDEAAFLGRDKKTPPLPTHWTQWPARKLFGDEKLKRIQKLRIVYPNTENASLKDLAAFDFVTHLKFNRNRQTGYELSDEDLGSVGRMSRLRQLRIGPPVLNGLHHLKDLQLTNLTCGGPDWSQTEFDSLANLQSLEGLAITTNQFDSKNMAALSKLKNLQTLRLTTGYNGKERGAIGGLAEIAELGSLRSLSLHGTLTDEEFKTLVSMKQLNSIYIGGRYWPESEIQRLRDNDSLEFLGLGPMEISVETYDLLVAAGIEVEHYGLTNDELSKDFFIYNDIYFPVDLEKSKIKAWCGPDSDSITVSISVAATPKPRHQWTNSIFPRLELYGFSYAGDWTELAGFKTSLSVDWDDIDDTPGNFYDGIHARTNNHKIEFLSRDKNLFHIKWTCVAGDSEDDVVQCSIDARIPFSHVGLNNPRNSVTLEQAKLTVAKHFDLNDFKPPRFAGRNDAWIIFDLKD